MIDTIIFDVGRVLVNWDYESYLKRFAFGPEKTKAITAATFESPYWRQFDRGILTPEEIVKGFCSLAPEYTEEIKEVFAHCEETITPLPYAESWVRSLKEKGYPPLHPLQLLRRPLRAHQRENALPPLHGRNPLLLHLPFNKTGTGDLPAPDPEILPHPGPLRIPRRHQSKRRGRRAGRDSWNSFYGI